METKKEREVLSCSIRVEEMAQRFQRYCVSPMRRHAQLAPQEAPLDNLQLRRACSLPVCSARPWLAAKLSHKSSKVLQNRGRRFPDMANHIGQVTSPGRIRGVITLGR